MIKLQISDQYLKVGIEAVQAASTIIQKYYQQNVEFDLKADNSPVTIADKKAEEKIKEVISSYFPDHGFVGEESGNNNHFLEYTWIIDPIDGTKNFLRHLPFFSTLLALVKNGQVIMGISYMPQFSELIYAVKGKGAYLNQQKLTVSKENNLSQAYLSFGSLSKFAEKKLLTNLVKLTQTVRQQRAWGDCWHFHLLAQGKIDAVIEAKGEFWDFAPIKIIIEEAGGQVSDIKAQDFTINSQSIIATNGLIHQQVVDYFL